MLLSVNITFLQVDNVVVECPFPKSVLNVTLTPNQGKYTFDPTSKVMVWDVGRIDPTKTPNIKGTVSIPLFPSSGLVHKRLMLLFLTLVL